MTSAVNGRCFQARSPAWLACALPRHPCFLPPPPTQEAGAAALNRNRDDSSKQKPNQASGRGGTHPPQTCSLMSRASLLFFQPLRTAFRSGGVFICWPASMETGA